MPKRFFIIKSEETRAFWKTLKLKEDTIKLKLELSVCHASMCWVWMYCDTHSKPSHLMDAIG